MTRLIRALAGVVWDALADACLTDGRDGSVLDGMRLTGPPPIEVTFTIDTFRYAAAMAWARKAPRQW